ncbi:MAG: phosphoserine phosphatase SerB [Pseudomonadota bacterium]
MIHKLYLYICVKNVSLEHEQNFVQCLKQHSPLLWQEWEQSSYNISSAQNKKVRCIESQHVHQIWKETLQKIVKWLDFDAYVLSEEQAQLMPELLVSDMDSTLIEWEVIDELAVMAGVGKQVADITEQAMQGLLDFETSLRQRVACLQGLHVEAIARLQKQLPLSQGAESLLKACKLQRVETALVSGGFMPFVEALQQRLGIDHVVANHLETQESILTGHVHGQIVDADFKAEFLKLLATKAPSERKTTVAVGDGANDLAMLQAADIGFAYHAKPIVAKAADIAIVHGGLDLIAYHFGWIR